MYYILYIFKQHNNYDGIIVFKRIKNIIYCTVREPRNSLDGQRILNITIYNAAKRPNYEVSWQKKKKFVLGRYREFRSMELNKFSFNSVWCLKICRQTVNIDRWKFVVYENFTVYLYVDDGVGKYISLYMYSTINQIYITVLPAT